MPSAPFRPLLQCAILLSLRNICHWYIDAKGMGIVLSCYYLLGYNFINMAWYLGHDFYYHYPLWSENGLAFSFFFFLSGCQCWRGFNALNSVPWLLWGNWLLYELKACQLIFKWAKMLFYERSHWEFCLFLFFYDIVMIDFHSAESFRIN